MADSSKRIEKYFAHLEKGVVAAYKVATDARKKGYDPEPYVDLPLARNMAQRVEGLVSAAVPALQGSGIIKRIQELEKKYGKLSWDVALIIAEEVAAQKFVKFGSKKEAMETGIRVGFAYHTVGIVAAPLEGFIELRIKRRRDGKEYCAASYAGPIRGAGGTGAVVSLLIADYVRKKMGYDAYDPDENEISRFIMELTDYHERVTNLQYCPSPEEITFLIKQLPIEIDGEPTEEIEVSNFKDLPRIETNKIRSGVCLVLSMLALKAPKLWKHLKNRIKTYDLDWGFLEPFLELQKQKKSKAGGKGSKDSSGAQKSLAPNMTYLADLVAGRPILTDPLAPGGFRLRYGRSRLSGFSAAAIHPATMHLLLDFIATGTQLKVERPGKAAAITPCDSITGPVVKLRDGSVVELNSEQEARRAKSDVVEILFLGDMMFNYGDFSENNHFLVPAGYCEEWWALELGKSMTDAFGSLDYDSAAYLAGITASSIKLLLEKPTATKISGAAAVSLSIKLGIPLHPAYTYHWKLLSLQDLRTILFALRRARLSFGVGATYARIVLPLDEGTTDAKRVFEIAGIPHSVVANSYAVFGKETSAALLATFGIFDKQDFAREISRITTLLDEKIALAGLQLQPGQSTTESVAQEDAAQDAVARAHHIPQNALEFLSTITLVKLRDRSGTFIGARMGRPEKAKMRRLTGSPHVLFPVGSEGGKLRSFESGLGAGKITAEFPIYYCAKHERNTIYPVCELCQKKTKKRFNCSECGITEHESCPKGGLMKPYLLQEIDIPHYFEQAKSQLKLHTVPDMIKGVRGTMNKDRIPEHICKGILRAKHDIAVNKDGTTRYDMSELPITHFTPAEIGTTVEKLKELGYDVDYHGEPLTRDDQLLELMPQDIILPAHGSVVEESADDVLLRIANFVDELLVSFYGLKPYYNYKEQSDIVGTLVIGLAPHISAGMIGRIVGFSKTSACYAHPLWHASLRRDCDGDEACVLLLMDALLNFSRQYLPDRRGGRTMDSPLVLTSKLVPSEVDDMVLGMDVAFSYPLEFYLAAESMAYCSEVKVEQLKTRLDTEQQYENFGFTHTVSSMNIGVLSSAYKTLPSMKDKLLGQMAIADLIRAVDARNVANLVIQKHFLKDIMGSLRQFSHQQFRCVSCNAKFRRPPLMGKCTACKGRLLFTISEGSIIKYLEPSISIAEKYQVSPYLRQSLELIKLRVEGTFGREKELQAGLGKWF